MKILDLQSGDKKFTSVRFERRGVDGLTPSRSNAHKTLCQTRIERISLVLMLGSVELNVLLSA